MTLRFKHTPEDDAGGPPLNLAAAIEEFYSEFPQHRSDVFILDHQKFATGEEAVESIAQQLDALQAAFPEAKTGLPKSMSLGAFEGKLPCSVNVSESMMNPKPEAKIFGRIVIPAGDFFTARALKSLFTKGDLTSNKAFPVMDDAFNNTEMWQRYVLDHELGHALTMLNIDKQSMKTVSFGNKAECEADAYSMIRHFQRYGRDSKFPAFIRDLRNMSAIHRGDVTHWTPRAINRVIALNEQGSLDALSPAQARDLAVEIAKETALSADAEANMSGAFKMQPLRMIFAGQTKTTPAEALLDKIESICAIGAATHSPAVHEACLAYIDVLENYVPPGMLAEVTPERRDAMHENVRNMMWNSPKTEPAISELSRALRDALIDAQSGQGKADPKKRAGGGPKR